MKPNSSPVVITGMHRSGTSLAASLLLACGVGLGDRLLAPDPANPRGYFEDTEFLELDREMLIAATLEKDGGHRDWGWTESEELDRSRLPAFEDRAHAVAEMRRTNGHHWGFKDPRASLLLDFWDAVLDEPVYLLVYRQPWEVADSLQRLGAEVFLRHPEYSYRIWAFYNRQILAFLRNHRDRCLLVSTDAAARRPRELLELVAERWGLDTSGAHPDEILDPRLLRRCEADDPLVTLAAATHPECAELLAELDAAADLPGSDLWRAHSLDPRHKKHTPGGGARVAVIVPCFDHGEFLVEAVASAERSIREPIELIVLNDGSGQARTLEVLASLKVGGYCVLDTENGGIASARNRAIEASTAPYLLPLDADNRLVPGFVERAADILDSRAETGVVYGDRRDFGLRSGFVDVPSFDLGELIAANFIDACALVRRQVWEDCGGYDSRMPAPGWEDWDLWLGACRRGWGFHHLPVEAFEYRVRPGSILAELADEESRAPLVRYLLSKHGELYREHLPELLLTGQRQSTSLFWEARLRERGDREIGSLQAQTEQLTSELNALREELSAFRERVAFMEQTRAWRVRRRLVAVKRRALGLLVGTS